MNVPRYQNLLRERLQSGTFVYTLEYVPELSGNESANSLDRLGRNAELVGGDARICGINIGDRVKSLDSLSTVECGKIAASASGKMPLLHLAGKDRQPSEGRTVIRSAFEAGLDTYLLVSGDRATRPGQTERIRYYDSVIAIRETRGAFASSFIAAAVSPFKYREEELLNQYLKLAKKINAGADYVVTNCGWDMRKFQELIWYCRARGFSVPLVANLLSPLSGWAKSIHARRLPGVFMSDDLYAKLQEEGREGNARAAMLRRRRLTLQIVGVKLMGYAGVQLSGVDDYEALSEVIDQVTEMEKSIDSLEAWQDKWNEANALPDGRVVNFGPDYGLYLFQQAPKPFSMSGPPVVQGVSPSAEELGKFDSMETLHANLFDQRAMGAKLLRPIFRLADTTEATRASLLKLEHGLKKRSLGCESCGSCRIEHLFYTCPEMCPKGLANGPCAGTDENTCEFKDRECIHNRKYRVAKSLGRLAELEEIYVHPVEETRGQSSWINEFKDPGGTSSRLIPIRVQPGKPKAIAVPNLAKARNVSSNVPDAEEA